MSAKSIVSIVILVLFAFILSSSLFTIQQGNEGIILQLGELKTTPNNQPKVYGPGIHMKVPVIDTVLPFDVRLQTLTIDSSRIMTAEQKYVIVSYYAKWRIADLSLFYQRTGGQMSNAEQLLSQKVNDALRAAFGKREIKEVIATDRQDIAQLLSKQANDSAQNLGIQVMDVRILAIDLPKEVRDSVFQRMSSQREQVAMKHRAQGKAQAEEIKATADKTVAIEIASAKAESQKIRAAGDAQASNIYTAAYSKNPEFYALYRSLQAYRDVFRDRSTIMVLKPSSPFMKYFQGGNAR